MSRYLLDKGVVRRLSEAFVRIDLELNLTFEQEQALIAFRHIVSHYTAFITIATFNLFRRRMEGIPHAQVILALTEILVPTKYARRWARRLREIGFSREDANLLATASFGTDKIIGGTFLSVDGIITFDAKMASMFRQENLVRKRFADMLSNIEDPYPTAKMPNVLTVGDFVGALI